MTIFGRIREWLVEPGARLSRRVAHGGVWSFLLSVLSRALSLVRTVVLARLLAPEDFGLFGITLLALSALERFTQTGFDAALIQKQEATRAHLDTAWAVQIGRGLLLALVLVLAAPHVAAFFEEPGAADLVRVLAVVAVVGGLQNIGVVHFRKELAFHRQFAFRLAGTVADLIAAVTAAVILRSAWALLVGLVAGRVVRTVASYLMHPYRPRLRFDRERARELFGFGRYITAQSMVLFLLTEGDDALVGKVLGAASLGFYQVAYRLSNAAATQITHVISQVTFPAYAKLQDRPELLNRGLRRTLGFTAFLSLPLAGALGALAPWITGVLLGDRWMPMVPAMQVMCVFGAMRAVGATFGPVYRAVARVDVPLKANVAQLVLLASVIYPLTVRWDILGTSVAITVSMSVALAYTSMMICRLTGLAATELFRPVLPPLAATGAAVALVLHLASVGLPLGRPAELVVLSGVGGMAYLTAAGLGYRALGYRLDELRAVVASMVGSPG